MSDNPFYKFLKITKKTFIYIGLFSCAVNLLMLVPTFYMLQLYDRVVTSKSGITLLMLTLVMLLLMTTMGLLDWVRSQIIVRLSAKLDQYIAPELYRKSFRQALEGGGSASASQPLSDLAGLRQFLSGPGLLAFFDAPWLPVYLGVMYYMHPYLGIAGTISAIALIILMVVNEKMTQPGLSQAAQLQNKAKNTTSRIFRNAEVIHAMGMLTNVFPQWEKKNQEILRMQMVTGDSSTLFRSISKCFRQVTQSLMLGLGAYLVITDQVNPGVMIAGSILLGRALSPVDQLIGAWKGVVSARDRYRRIVKIAQEEERKPVTRLPAPRGEISAEKIAVKSYQAKKNIIESVTFRIQPGTITAVIGASGSGKSTLAKALVGIWPVTAGSLRIDGAEYTQWDQEELGHYIGYLPQDVELFEGSIAENIARLGDFESDDVVNAAKLAGIHEMILELPEGYDTRLSNSGGGLSGGQRQRVGLARAVYGNPKLVVLDEPNSNLDEEGDMRLAEALLRLKKMGITVVLVTHKKSFLNISDYLLVMNKGRSMAFGDVSYVIEQLNHKPARIQSEK